jgi:hypothetical protein
MKLELNDIVCMVLDSARQPQSLGTLMRCAICCLLVLLGLGFANLLFLRFGSQSLLWLLTGASEKTRGFLG